MLKVLKEILHEFLNPAPILSVMLWYCWATLLVLLLTGHIR